MRFLLAALIAFLFAVATLATAFAQGGPVLQSGGVTRGHAPMWSTNGVVGDSGGAAAGALKELGIGNTGLPLCINDQPPVALGNGAWGPPGVPYHQLCFGANSNGGGSLTYGAMGGASQLPFQTIVNGQIIPIPGSINGMPAAATTAALQAMATTAATCVVRLDSSSGNGAPAVIYCGQVGNCSLFSGAGDGGLQIPASGGGCWVAKFSGPADPRVWNAKCDGSTDDGAILNKAFASGITSFALTGVCRSASATILIPDGVNFTNQGSFQQTYPIVGGAFQCGLSVTPCVKVGNATNSPNVIGGFSVTRDAGTIPSTAVGVLVNGGDNVTLRDLFVYRQAQGVQFLNVTGTLGIDAEVDHLYTCGITDADLVVTGWPGLYVSKSFLGCNGAGDVTHNTYVRVNGNWDATAGTVKFTDTHFNLGSNTVVCGVAFQGFTGSTNVITDFEILGGHMETAQNAICTDTSVKGLTTFVISSVWFGGGWGGNNHFFADISNSYAAGLNAATTINSWSIGGLGLTGWADLTLAPTSQINDLKIAGSSLIIPISLTGVSNSTATLQGNTFNGITVAGHWAAALFSGTNLGGAISNTATSGSSIELDIPGLGQASGQASMVNCSSGFGLQFGGAATGITYSPAPVCQYILHGNEVTVDYYIQLSSVGSATGAAQLVGLPFTSSGSNGLGMFGVFNSGMTGLTSPILIAAGAASKVGNLYQQGATGLAVLTDANFTNASVVSGKLTYLVGNTP